MLPMRVELIISSLQDWCLTAMALEALSTLNIIIIDGIRASGIEPELCDWKSHSLPLTYTRSYLKNKNKYGCRKSNPGLLLGRQSFYH